MRQLLVIRCDDTSDAMAHYGSGDGCGYGLVYDSALPQPHYLDSEAYVRDCCYGPEVVVDESIKPKYRKVSTGKIASA